MKELRFGVIGCGGIAQMMHIPHLMEHEQFKLVALADPNTATLDAVGDRYGIRERYTDYRDLLARDDVDAVGIFHGGSHRDTVIAALDANKHVFVEKPLTWSLREAEEVAARAANSDRIVQLGYHKLYDPGFEYARDRVREMRDLGYVRITVLHPADQLGHSTHRVRRGNGVIEEGHPQLGTWDELVLAERMGAAEGSVKAQVDEALGARKDDNRLRLAYGEMCGSIIHQIYTLYGFLGEPEGVLHTDVWREGLSIHSVISYPNDLRVSLDWQFLAYLKDYREEYAFFGNSDRVMLQLPSPYLHSFPSPIIVQGHEGELAWEKRVVVSYDEAFRRELLAFYNNVQQNKQPISSVGDALKHARFIQQMIDAAS